MNTTTIKITGIKQAISDYLHNPHLPHKNFMIDLSDGKVWCDCFLSCNTWNVYRSDSIVNIDCIINGLVNCEQPYVTMALLKQAVEIVIDMAQSECGYHGCYL